MMYIGTAFPSTQNIVSAFVGINCSMDLIYSATYIEGPLVYEVAPPEPIPPEPIPCDEGCEICLN